MRWSKILFAPVSGVLFVTSCFAADTGAIGSMKDCSFNSAPEEFLSAQSRIRAEIGDRLQKLGSARYTAGPARSTVAAASVVRQNFIDEQIFEKMAQAGADAAPLTTDEEFVRRITLDLTGRIPTSQQVRDFV